MNLQANESRLTPPPDAWDCHMHVFEPGFPIAPTATAQPPLAPVAAYRKVQAALGLAHAVVVQPTAYGFDNRCTLQAMAALGPAARGIVVIQPSTARDELDRLHRLGVRGVRYMMLAGGALAWESLEATACAIEPLGWHIDLQLDGRYLPQHEAQLRSLPCRLVIDHNGKFLSPVPPSHAGCQALLRLLQAGRCWVKLSAPYETSKVGPPSYDDVGDLARAFVSAAPERCLWASNWPHLNTRPAPSDADLLDLLLAWTDDASARQRILVENPAALYR